MKGWVVQKMEPKSTFLKYDLTEVKKYYYLDIIIDIQLGSKYASVNITLRLKFF